MPLGTGTITLVGAAIGAAASVAVAAIGYFVGYQQQQLDREKFKYEQVSKVAILAGEDKGSKMAAVVSALIRTGVLEDTNGAICSVFVSVPPDTARICPLKIQASVSK